jgi:RNA polymerase sigma-70 factor (ECF subfamily)
MRPAEPPDPERLMADARLGHAGALGALLDLYRNYLNLLARTQIDLHLHNRVDSSDVVQETLLDACRDFDRFRGGTEAELLSWLRHILVCNLAAMVQKHVAAHKRDVRRQVSLESRRAELDRSSAKVESCLIGNLSSPSERAQRRERAAILADQLAKLPHDYHEVIVLRNLESLSFDEVALRMGRTPGAVRVLWVRALDQLRQLLKREDLI